MTGAHNVRASVGRIMFCTSLTYLDTGLLSTEAGLDVVMPESVYWGESGGNLTISVKNGSLAESRVTDIATRIIAARYQMGQDVSRLSVNEEPLTDVFSGGLPRARCWNGTRLHTPVCDRQRISN